MNLVMRASMIYGPSGCVIFSMPMCVNAWGLGNPNPRDEVVPKSHVGVVSYNTRVTYSNPHMDGMKFCC